MKIWQRSLIALAMVTLGMIGEVAPSLARRSGGRVGGSSFKSSPSRSSPSKSSPSKSSPSRSSPNRSVPSNTPNSFNSPNRSTSPSRYTGGVYYSGNGDVITRGFEYSIVIFIVSAILLFALIGWITKCIIDASRKPKQSKVNLLKIQVGLLASARSLQQELIEMALNADTDSTAGLTQVLHETAITLLRHPEYWTYVNSANELVKLDLSESKFNSLVLTERSKLNEEPLSNVRGRLSTDMPAHEPVEQSEDAPLVFAEISEYIVVTLLIAATGEALSKLPLLRSAEQLELSLQAIGKITADQLLAVEILWEPQSEDYTLTNDDVISVYPDLIRI